MTSVAREQQDVVAENRQYEPLPSSVTFAAREQGEVKNSLYESVPGPVTSAAREEQGEVVENRLMNLSPAP